MQTARANDRPSVFRTLDWFTVAIYLILVVAGALSIYAATYTFDDASIFDITRFSGKQFLWIGLGLVLAVVLLLLDYHLYEDYAYPIYGVMILILIVTILVASPINGSRSWIVLGPVSIQPAEFGKFATALVLARLFGTYGFSLRHNPGNYLRALILIFIPIILILLQNETGSALVYFSLVIVLYREGMSGLILFAVIFSVTYFVLAIKFSEILVMGMTQGEVLVMSLITGVFLLMLWFYCRQERLTLWIFCGLAGVALVVTILGLCGVELPLLAIWIIALALASIAATAFALRAAWTPILTSIAVMACSILFMFSVNYVFTTVLQPHQQGRIRVALGIDEDLRGAGYNVNQSKIAIGSGGFAGKGFLNGTQTKLNYVPEQHTDFIYSTIGEEEGFLGSTAVILLFVALILRLIYLSERQTSTFSRVYGYCLVSYFTFHVLINIGMVIGLCPVIGIPLPYFSYGGSSLWSFTILLFIFLRLDAAREPRTADF